jgi:hypothetical protein
MIFSSVLLIASVSAASGLDPARMLQLNGNACKMAISTKALSTEAADTARSEDDRKKSLADVEKYAPEAIKSAAGLADLENAIKVFYAAADAYCKNPSNAGDRQFDDAEKTLDKLLDAAGR